MSARRHLDKLLNDFVDLEQDNYFLIKEHLQQGITMSVEGGYFSQIDTSNEHITSIISRLPIKVINQPTLMNLRGLYALHIMENETLEIDIYCSSGRKMGLKTINFDKLKYNIQTPSYLRLSKWFLYHLSKSEQVEIFLRVPNFSVERSEWEKNNFIGNSRGYVNKLKEESEWGLNNMNHLLEETGWAVERLKLFGKEWPSHNPLMVQELMDLNLIHFHKVLDWHYFLTNFWTYSISNEQLLSPPNDYEIGYKNFLNKLNIKERDYVAN